MKDKINELAKTKRGKLKLKFAGYIVFLAIIIIIMASTGSFNNIRKYYGYDDEPKELVKQEENKETCTYIDKQTKLINSTYNYKYSIDNPSVVYSGIYKDGVREGFRETEQEIIKYREEENNAFIINMGEEEEILDLYQGLDAQLFNLSLLFKKLNSENAIINKDMDITTYSYENTEKYNYLVTTNQTEITKIEITNDDVKYIFTFSY